MRLLIVEDETALCNSIAEGLRMDGYPTLPLPTLNKIKKFPFFARFLLLFLLFYVIMFL